MPNRTYFKSISRVIETPFLVVEVHSDTYDPPRWIFNVPLMAVLPHEESLEGGRFKRHDTNLSENCVSMPIGAHASLEAVWFATMVEWVDGGLLGRWNFEVSMNNVCKGTLNWYFDNIRDAKLFKIKFSPVCVPAESDDA